MSLPTYHRFRVSVALLAVFAAACTPARMVFRNTPGHRDYVWQPTLVAQAGETPFQFVRTIGRGEWATLIDTITFRSETHTGTLPGMWPNTGTLAVIVIQNDTIKYEAYFNEHSDTALATTFSVAKAFVGTLLGIAIREGYVRSVEDPIVDYLPELAGRGFDSVRVKHLGNMCSGLQTLEAWAAFMYESGKLYYDPNLTKTMFRKRADPKKLGEFHYLNTNTELLALLLARATGKPLIEYFEEKLWKPLGMEGPAHWAADNRGPGAVPKAFCCLNARALDFAKYARLYLKSGNWNGCQIVDSAWVQRAFGLITGFEGNPEYRYHWMTRYIRHGWYFTGGLYGQWMAIAPQHNLVVVHFAKTNLLADRERHQMHQQLMKALPPFQKAAENVVAHPFGG